jgi:putative glutamine amidotransferase
MNNKIKTYVIGGGWDDNWVPNHIPVKKMEDADLVILTGGADISPDLYGDVKHSNTYTNPSRDEFEVYEAKKAMELGKHIIGICRGHQLLGALNGTKLIQDQHNPGQHNIHTYEGNIVKVNSIHHQAVYPFNLDKSKYKILAWTEGINKYHKNGKDEEMNPEVEVESIYFPETKCLGVQYHPEGYSIPKDGKKFSQELVLKFLNNEL